MGAAPERLPSCIVLAAARRAPARILFARVLHVFAQAGTAGPRLRRAPRWLSSTGICAPSAKITKPSIERVTRQGWTSSALTRISSVERHDGQLQVSTPMSTPVSQAELVDMVVLSTGMEPQADQLQVAKIFGISLSPDGFFLEKHPKLAPVETATDGVFLAGACQGPKDIPDSVAQGGAAAAAALSLHGCRLRRVGALHHLRIRRSMRRLPHLRRLVPVRRHRDGGLSKADRWRTSTKCCAKAVAHARRPARRRGRSDTDLPKSRSLQKSRCRSSASHGGTAMNLSKIRTGVYICHCGTNIAATVDVKAVAEYARRWRALSWRAITPTCVPILVRT